jgi:two-component system, OmpR family, sensor kinase
MTHARNGIGFWRSVRELPERTPLRVKLISAVLALVILALAVISFAGISYVRSYLLDRADNQVEALVGQFSGSSYRSPGQYVPGPQVGERGVAEIIAPSGTYALAIHDFSYPLSSTGPAVPTSASWLSANSSRPVTVSSQSGTYKWRVIVEPNQTVGPVTGTIVIGLDVTDIYATVARLEAFDLLVSLGIVVILAIAATAAVRASLRPLDDIEETAGAIAAGDLTQRVPEGDPRTEVGRLGQSLNTMLSQIEQAFRARQQSEAAARRSEERMRQFVADASHELRTPLTAIRGFAEYYRQRGGVETGTAGGSAAGASAAGASSAGASSGRAGASGASPEPGTGTEVGAGASGGAPNAAAPNGGAPNGSVPNGSRKGPLAAPDMDRIMRRVEQESARMGMLVEDMLLLARMDQQRPLEARPVDLLTMAADAVHDARVVAPGRSINLTVDTSRAPLVIGDEVRLRQVIGNLMSNALNHTPDGTPVDVVIRSGSLGEALSATAMAQPPAPNPSHPAVVLEVADHGPGLSEEQAEHVFERFYRADTARTSGGTGLGLAIVAALVVAHGGSAWVQSEPGEGATFSFALPLSPEAVQDDQDEDSDLDGFADDPSDHGPAAHDPYLAPADDLSGQPWVDSAGRTRGNIV